MDLKIAIVGATGYTGEELYRLLRKHPRCEVTLVTSERQAGRSYADSGLILRSLKGINVAQQAELVFCCLPHHEAMTAVAVWVKQGLKVIDLSADFRLHNVADYRQWYGEHSAPELLKKAVYGLPELHRKRIVKAHLVANPGCYPTSAILGLAPLLKKKLMALKPIVIDAKSGISGAGRDKVEGSLGAQIKDSMFPYNVGRRHRHTPEIEQGLAALAGRPVQVTFIPQVIPIHRGMLTAIHVVPKKKLSEQQLVKIYQDFYRGEPFVEILPAGTLPEIRPVVLTNKCVIGFSADSAPTLSIFTALDNLTKGASGQAVQNMNLMCGLEETTGLI